MRARIHRGWLVSFLALSLLPLPASAEVSVQTDSEGVFKRFFYLTCGQGARQVAWGQVRPGIAPALVLNSLGDNLGDLAPRVLAHPSTGHPWVVWSMNEASIKHIGFAYWDGKVWTERRRVTPADPYAYDELDPILAFDFAGNPYLVWWRAEQTAKVYFSTRVNGVWTPPLLLSDPSVDSRNPAIVLNGSTAFVTWETSSGTGGATWDAATLLRSASNLMDSPLPPGLKPPDAPSDGDGGQGPLLKR